MNNIINIISLKINLLFYMLSYELKPSNFQFKTYFLYMLYLYDKLSSELNGIKWTDI